MAVYFGGNDPIKNPYNKHKAYPLLDTYWFGRMDNYNNLKTERMKTYTKEQLIKAQTAYNKNWIEKPEGFSKTEEFMASDPAESATLQIEYLLGLVEDHQ